MRKRICLGLLIVLFFTACTPKQAVKNYYQACLKGDFVRAERHVVRAQKESCRLFADQMQKEDKAFLKKRHSEVRQVEIEKLDDTTAVASCLLIEGEKNMPYDTVRRTVLVKKEGLHWGVCNGMLFGY